MMMIRRTVVSTRALPLAISRLGGFSLAVLLAGCVALLPRSDSGAKSLWANFDTAKENFNRVEPYETNKAELVALGLDPISNPNITILNYSDIIRRFIPSSAVAAENLDRGISECIAAKNDCSAYEIDVKSLKRKRAGNFWLDALNFKRHTEISGWRFTGLIVLKNDLVVYKLWGGQPSIQEAENTRNPLGPFQGIAEGAARQAVQY
jgi:hypothetical protein